jgi:hypothetical protein
MLDPSDGAILIMDIDFHRLLNDNSLSGEVPPALGALPVRGAILKYVHFVVLHSVVVHAIQRPSLCTAEILLLRLKLPLAFRWLCAVLEIILIYAELELDHVRDSQPPRRLALRLGSSLA